MTGTAPQPAVVRPQASGPGRGPVEHLLHALNQPLTGLQCSMELAIAGPHPAAYYLRTLEEGLELVSRARVLVGALRQVVDVQDATFREVSLFRIDRLLREIGSELEPVALSKGMALQVFAAVPLFVHGSRSHMSNSLLRLLDSVLALAVENKAIHLSVTAEDGKACVMISWTPASASSTAFSTPELGMLISRAAWERAGGTWARGSSGENHTCILCMALAPSPQPGRAK